MKKAVIAVILFLFSAIMLMQDRFSPPVQVCFGDSCFSVETASTQEERSKGLMFRENLAGESGMLFLFEEEGYHPFWMKNTLIPLDIIWLDKDKKVVFMKESAQPCNEDPCLSINPGIKAVYVLEIGSGAAAKAGIKTGDKAVFNPQD